MMTTITITVENEEHKDDIVKVLEKAEVNGELDFTFGVQTEIEDEIDKAKWLFINTIEFTTSWCVQDVRNELGKEVADMTDEEIYEELESLYKRFEENAVESGWVVIDSCFDTKPKENEVK